MIRDLFIQRFGEQQAVCIEAAAVEHANGINSANRGSDTFKWAILICIGYQCMELDRYREHHGITAPWEHLKSWIIDHAELNSHDGDCDYLAAFCGSYDEYVGVGNVPN